MGKIKERAGAVRLEKRLVRNIVLLHPILLTVLIVLALFLFAFLFCWISVEIDLNRGLKIREFVKYLYTEWSVETALSLLIGYLGMGATVVLGLIALRFSFKTEERARIAELQNIAINDIQLYDMYENAAPSEMKCDGIKGHRFLLKMELLGGSFSYEYQIDQVWWGACDESDANTGLKPLENCQAYVENAGTVTIYVYFDEFEGASKEEKESSIAYFFHIGEYVPLLMNRYKRHRWIRLEMNVRETVWMEKRRPEEFMAKFEILVENRNERNERQEKRMELHEIRRHIRIDNTYRGRG